MATTTRNSGFGLIEIVIALAMMAIALVAFQKMTVGALRAERGVASNLEHTEISKTLDLILDSKESCAKSGLIGVNVSSLLDASASSVPLSISVPGGGVFLTAGATPTSTRTVESIGLTNLEEIKPVGANTLYFATLQMELKSDSRSLTFRDPKKSTYLNLEIEPVNKTIVSCFRVTLPTTSHRLVECSATLQYTWSNGGVVTSKVWGCVAACDSDEIPTGGGSNFGATFMATAGGIYSRPTVDGHACSVNVVSCSGGSMDDGCGDTIRCYTRCSKTNSGS